ncbi:HEPN domain-containing protein [Rhodoplanes sp. SY1]|uniref:HEPN domain-containing protein n=1 Tax=Rhodoplanes sp. SY1 TaxID=3166646 RepID=UPI0038B6867F
MSDVDRVFGELRALRDLLRKQGEASDVVSFEELAAKTLLLCAASYFERHICSSLIQAARETGSSEVFCSFIEKQALKRKYHTLFDWTKPNANAFFGLFGQSVKEALCDRVSKDEGLESAVREFMFINSQRNKLVHDNFAGTSAEVTFEEAWTKYNVALKFADWLPTGLKNAAGAAKVPEQQANTSQ